MAPLSSSSAAAMFFLCMSPLAAVVAATTVKTRAAATTPTSIVTTTRRQFVSTVLGVQPYLTGSGVTSPLGIDGASNGNPNAGITQYLNGFTNLLTLKGNFSQINTLVTTGGTITSQSVQFSAKAVATTYAVNFVCNIPTSSAFTFNISSLSFSFTSAVIPPPPTDDVVINFLGDDGVTANLIFTYVPSGSPTAKSFSVSATSAANAGQFLLCVIANDLNCYTSFVISLGDLDGRKFPAVTIAFALGFTVAGTGSGTGSGTGTDFPAAH